LFSRPEEDEADVAMPRPAESSAPESRAASSPIAAAPEPARPEIHELETERYDVEVEWGVEERQEDDEAKPASARGRLGRLFGASRRREADRSSEAPATGRSAEPPVPEADAEPDHSPAPAAPAPAADASPAPLPDPAGRGMRPRRLQPDLSPASRFERAISRFNGSDAGRTAAGLTRTLGAPSVSVGDLAGAEDVVRVTVAWELTWYQWGVDLGDELRPVFELEKGFEVSEIDAAARQWNASAHDGRIVMIAPPRHEAESGRPVHR
jgi:hypothetical protein